MYDHSWTANASQCAARRAGVYAADVVRFTAEWDCARTLAEMAHCWLSYQSDRIMDELDEIITFNLGTSKRRHLRLVYSKPEESGPEPA